MACNHGVTNAAALGRRDVWGIDTMWVLVFDGRVAFRDNHPMPTPPPGEALLQVRRG
jgi:hypothetical protein